MDSIPIQFVWGRFDVSESLRVPPAAFKEVLDDLAVEIGIVMRKKGIRLVNLQRLMGISAKRTNAISRWLRGLDHPIGVHGAVRVAEAVGVPVRVLCGTEAILPEPRIVYVPRPRARRPIPSPIGQIALPLKCAA